MGSTLVTGANGFVGSALCASLAARKIPFRGAVRNASIALQDCSPGHLVEVGDIGNKPNWQIALEGIDTVVHLAARAHVMQHKDLLAESVLYRQVNFAGTEGLAKAAAASGVRRLVFLSTIKVNGEATTTRPFSEQDIPNPQDLYADSKNEAEQFLRRISAETGLEVVILRTPLVYGAAVKANFLRLMQWVDRGIPLPLSSVKNKRSMIYLGNLVDALICCVEHPSASGKTFVVSDGEDISTADLIRKIALAMGRPARLLPCPEKMLRFLAGLAGKSQDIDRLLTSLQLDSHGIRQDLDWAPPYTLDQGVIETVNWYLQNKQSNNLLKCAV